MNILLRKVRGISGLSPVLRNASGPSFGTGAPPSSIFGVLASPLALGLMALVLFAVWLFADPSSPIALPFVMGQLAQGELKDLQQKRNKAITDARALNDKATAEKRELTAEEEATYQAFMKEGRDLKKKIDREVELVEEERSLAERHERDTPVDPDSDPPAPNESPEERCERIMRQVRAMDNNKYAALAEIRSFGAALRYQASSPTERRAMVESRALEVTDQTAGGYLQPPQEFIARLIQGVDNLTFIRRIATVFQVPQAESLGAPSLDNDPADPTWVSELSIGTEDSTMSVGKRELRPHPLAQFIKVSRTLLRKAAIGPEALVRDRLAYKTSVVQESAFLTGNGVNKPLGVMTASADGISTGRDVSTGNTTTSMTFDGLKAAKWSIKSQYWPRLQWIFHPDGGEQIDKLKDGNGQYIWQPSVIVGQPDRLLSFPVNFSEYQSNTFTTGLYVGILGDFSQYWIADALSMEIQRLNELYAGTNQVGFLIRSETDGAPVLEEAFARVKLG